MRLAHFVSRSRWSECSATCGGQSHRSRLEPWWQQRCQFLNQVTILYHSLVELRSVIWGLSTWQEYCWWWQLRFARTSKPCRQFGQGMDYGLMHHGKWKSLVDRCLRFALRCGLEGDGCMWSRPPDSHEHPGWSAVAAYDFRPYEAIASAPQAAAAC